MADSIGIETSTKLRDLSLEVYRQAGILEPGRGQLGDLALLAGDPPATTAELSD